MKKLKIIQLIDALNVGGAEVLAVNIANGLSEIHVESHLCATRKEGSLKENIDKSVPYLFLNRKRTIDLVAIFKLKKYIKKHGIQIIHAHSTSSFVAFCVKLICPKVKIVWHDHFGNSEFLECRKKYPLRIFSYSFSHIITVNEKLKTWAIQNLSCPKVNFTHNFPFFMDGNKKTILKGVAHKRIVHLAGFRAQKDHLNLLKAFVLFQKEFPDWTLHLVGKQYNDSYSKGIVDFIAAQNLKNEVFLYGVQSDIAYILSQASIGVLSSKSEGLPISLLEYGLANLPVLITDVGECKNVINNPNAIVESRDSVKFGNALKNIIENNALKEQIRKEVHSAVQQRFSREKILQELMHTYHQLC